MAKIRTFPTPSTCRRDGPRLIRCGPCLDVLAEEMTARVATWPAWKREEMEATK